MSKSTTEIRQAFLDFFQEKGHQIIASSPLLSRNDPTLLFTNAGMNQFKYVFLGLDNCNYLRATTSQRCVRAGGKHNDLEKVGYTARHHTFFEMLGNFSFGDYFKYDAIQFAWELLTSRNWFNLPKERFLVTVYKTDDETYKIWKKEIGIPQDRIILIGDKKSQSYISDNFWQMSDTGPCGPCTEIFYDRGSHIWGGPPGSMEENGDRYIEIWNIVFMQFNRQSNGMMEPLPKLSVDTGMGLERVSAILQQVNSNYEIDIFQTLIEMIAKIIKSTNLSNKSLYVIADHIRSCAFLIADGVIPSNEKHGYVLRRIIRRAIRHGKMLGVKETFFYKLVKPLISVMGSAGEVLKYQQVQIEHILKTEEEQFAHTLNYGLTLLSKELEKLEGDLLDGRIVFRLYDTYGFPVDLTADICRERNIKIDKTGFETAMEEQRHRARTLKNFNVDYNTIGRININTVTNFKGYDYLELNSKVAALFTNGKNVDSIDKNQNAIVFLDKTPFYAESGGQIGDIGEIKNDYFTFEVSDTQKYDKAIGHIGKLTYGSLKVGKSVKAQVDKIHRMRICMNHTATHLMHTALREILGFHVEQRGSLVTDKMLRFDFSHHKAMKLFEIRAVEDLVNMQIRRNLPVEATTMDLNTAKEKSAIALFGEKYGEHVRVLSIGDFSTELCCGTHVSRTGDIGLFHINSESGIAAGIRRIQGLTGENAIANLYIQIDQLNEIAQLLKVKGNDQRLGEKVRTALKRIGQLGKELQQLKKRLAVQESEKLFSKVVKIKDTKLLISNLTEIEPKMLYTIASSLKNQLGSSIIVLATVIKNKVFLILGISKDVSNLVKADELIDIIIQQVNGKSGGYTDMVQVIGTNIAALPKVLANIENWISSKL